MVWVKIPQPWQLPDSHITPESAFFSRRRFLKTLVGAGIGASLLPAMGCQANIQATDPDLAATFNTISLDPYTLNSAFTSGDRPQTEQVLASQYNNFYEFGGTKSIWKAAQNLPLEDWKVTVGGLVKTPQTYDIDDLRKKFPLEERIYRFRCVEAWSMVLPWLGFPMRRLIEAVDPLPTAKFVRFTSYYDKAVTPGPGLFSNLYPWPYVEGLRIEEMANELAFFAVGLYGHALPKQHGAPLRMVLPWKYGFKGAKSIVKIEFVDKQPATFWNTIQANEYGFEANVEPDVPHPRWSQAKERFISKGPDLTWEEKPTLLYNGYGDYVADLYPRRAKVAS